MERLSEPHLRRLLDCLGDLYEIRPLDAFAERVVGVLPRLVSSEIITYNEVNPRQRRIHWTANPRDFEFPGALTIFEQHMADHPLITRYARTRDGQALKISDFLTTTQLRRLGLYNEFYRRLDVAYQMAIELPSPPPVIIGIALNRSRRDFSERDRLVLNLLRPHLARAYDNAAAVSKMQRELSLISQGVETTGGGVILIAPDGHVRSATPRARQWLSEYFGRPALRRDRLPDTLHRWVSEQERRLAGTGAVPPPREPLAVEREGRRLVVRLISEAGTSLLLLDEQLTALPAVVLEALGLTRREAEVLAWVAQGKTDGETALILGMRPRTVGKHLEHVYQKLGVETRTTAAARALEVAAGPLRSPL